MMGKCSKSVDSIEIKNKDDNPYPIDILRRWFTQQECATYELPAYYRKKCIPYDAYTDDDSYLYCF